MLLKKKLDNEFGGFLASAVPRGPRSARKWGPRKKNDDGQICAFELLASLAGELLKESESSASSNGSEAYDRIDQDHIKRENPDGYKLSEADADGRSCQNNIYFSDQTCNDVDPSSITKKPCNDKNRVEKRQRAMDQAELFVKSLAVVNSGRKIEPSLLRKTISSSSFYSPRTDIKLGSRDDDENFTRCGKLDAKLNHFRLPSRIADRRIRKLLNSKYWKAAPKLRDCKTVRAAMANGVRKPFYRKRKSYSNRERYYRGALYKRRRFTDHHSVVTSDGGMSSESVSNSPEKNLNLHGGPSLGSSHQSSFPSEDSNVKFSINSFKVPELLIEVPENATVGSLKRSVMEALTAILGRELCVGVIHHGKKVRDDKKTLLQTGLSCKDNIDMLNFTLEPDHMEAHSPPFLACDTSDLLIRLPGSPVLDQELSDDHPAAPMMKCVNQDENNHELISSQTDVLTDEAPPDSKALVVVPDFTMDPLAVVPAKPKRSEPVQRRTRRPFSVSEVESLVKAVEDLGTGRWRDVKLRAFEDADHRTYVDLKDKWKTLVHTARIAPQQRRGEPVPQELLNRVLAAQAFWSQHQAKQPGKQGATLKAMEIEAESFVEGIPSVM